MDIFGAEPNPNDPIPPTYELSQQEYETKVSDALQRSLRISNPLPQVPTPPAPNQYQTWDDRASRLDRSPAQSAYPVNPPPRAPSSNAGSSPHHRQNSISSSSGASSSASGYSRASSRPSTKERPAWYREAGLGANDPGSGPRRHGDSPRLSSSYYQSGSSSQTASPTDDTAPRLPHHRQVYLVDEEAGIDNPPPPFGASSLTPTARLPNQPFPSPTFSTTSSATSPDTYYSAQSRTQSPRSSYEGPAPHPHVRDSSSPNAFTNGHPRHPRRRTGSNAFGSFSGSPFPPAGAPVSTSGPQLQFDKSLAYGGAQSITTGGAPAINPADFYSSAVSAMFTPSKPASSSIPAANPTPSFSATTTYLNTPQRQPTQPPSQYPDAYSLSRSSQSHPQSSPQQPQSQSRRPSSAIGYSTASSTWTLTENRTPRPPSANANTSSYQQQAPSAYTRRSSQENIYANTRSPSRNSIASTMASAHTYPGTPYAPATPQKQQNAFYPSGVGAATSMTGGAGWVPPGAAAPANVYERRFV